MSQTILANASAWLVAGLAASLVVAGLVKGMIGVGMPIVAFPLISAFVDVRATVMLLAVPLILTNVPQALEGGNTIQCFVGLIPVLLGMAPGILLGIAILLHVSASLAKLISGLVVISVAVLMIAAPKFHIKGQACRPVGAIAGFFGGIMGGIAAMSGPLVFTFLLAKGLTGRAFTKEASLFLVLSASLLAGVLATNSSYSWSDLAISTAALFPVGVGMFAGQRLRDAIAAKTFKTFILVVVLISGFQLVYRGLFA